VHREIFKHPGYCGPHVQQYFVGDRENDAEHTCLMILLAVYLDDMIPQEICRGRLYKMMAIHDVVEILSGDWWYLDEATRQRKQELEKKSAEKMFAVNPELLELWGEYEERKTLTAVWCKYFDILQAVLSLVINEGANWKKNRVTYEMETNFSKFIWEGDSGIGEILRILLHDARMLGYFYEGPPPDWYFVREK